MALPQHNEQLPRWLQQQKQQQQLPSPFGNPPLQQHQACLHSFSAQVAAEGTAASHGVAPDLGLHHEEGSGTASSAFNEGLLDFNHAIWQNAKLKASIVCHPLYEELLAAHLECLRVATPVEQLPRLDEQLATIPHLAAKYSVLGSNVVLDAHEKRELHHVMESYILLLQSFKEQLQEHLRGDATQAVLFCCEFEQAFARLTGVAIEEGSGATMSDEEEEYIEDVGAYYYNLNRDFGEEIFPFGPVIPTETEKSTLNRVRRDLKLELKQSFRSRIADVREEIMRKRRAGKLPGQTINILKRWWNAHPKWPYPTEEEKAELVEETGLELRQINNWFINQRKRNHLTVHQTIPRDH